MKRLLLVAVVAVVAAAVAIAWFAVPTNAATVNGIGISQSRLNDDLTAIANSKGFQCYLEATNALRSGGSSGALPPIHGVGASNGNNGTYNTAFVSQWLSQLISGEVVKQVAARRGAVVTDADRSLAKADLAQAIDGTISQVQNSQFQCPGVTSASVFASLPPSFVDELVSTQANSEAVAASEPGSGISEADIARYVAAHPDELSQICVTVVPFSSQASAQQFLDQVNAGGSFNSLAAGNTSTQTGCTTGAQSPLVANVEKLNDGQVSGVINYQNSGTYVVMQVTRRTPATVAGVANLVRQLLLSKGEVKASAALTAAVHASDVTVDPRYGRWSSSLSSSLGVIAPTSPPPSTLTNPTVNTEFPTNASSAAAAG